MYAGFFGLEQAPFSIAPDPRYLYMSDRHREALAHLLYGVQGGGGFVLLTGEIGAGKTTVCRAFLEQMPTNCHVAYIFNPRLTVPELLHTVCEEFGIALPADASPASGVKAPVDRLNAFLLQAHAAGERALLIIDEAQNLPADVLEQLRLLTNLETSERKLLQIVLIGQPELRTLLTQPALEQLAQRVIARFHLGALDEADTAQYVQHRLQVAGLQGPAPFAADTLRRVHQLTRGVPRRINLLCDRALLGAYAGGQRLVNRAVLNQAAAEVFDGTTPAARPAHRPWPAWAWLALGALAATVAGAGTWWWLHRPASQMARGAPAALPSPPSASPSPVVVPLGSDPVLPVDLLATEAAAWRQLAALWGLPAAAEHPCEQAPLQQMQCYRTPRMTLHGLRQLDRPAVLTLQNPGQTPAHALLVGLDGEHLVFNTQGRPWTLSEAALARIWSGAYASFWRTPPGRQGHVANGFDRSVAPWMQERLSLLQARGDLPTSARTLAEQVRAFQTAHGIEANGIASPTTLILINRATGVAEPRLEHGVH